MFDSAEYCILPDGRILAVRGENTPREVGSDYDAVCKLCDKVYEQLAAAERCERQCRFSRPLRDLPRWLPEGAQNKVLLALLLGTLDPGSPIHLLRGHLHVLQAIWELAHGCLSGLVNFPIQLGNYGNVSLRDDGTCHYFDEYEKDHDIYWWTRDTHRQGTFMLYQESRVRVKAELHWDHESVCYSGCTNEVDSARALDRRETIILTPSTYPTVVCWEQL